MINEETATGDIAGFTPPLGDIQKRPSFKEFLTKKKKPKKKDDDVLQKQEDERAS